MPTPLSANDINIAIDILADTKQAVTNINTATNAVNQYIKAAERANSVSKASGGMIPPVPQTEIDKVKKFGDALGQVEVSSKKATSSLGRFNVVTTALGILLSQVIHGAINLVSNTFKMAVDNVKNLEVAFYNLTNAEKAMSQSGTEVTLIQLGNVIDTVRKKFKGMFSKTELTDATADIAIAVKDLGFGATEIEKMLTAIGVVKLRTPSSTMKDVTAHTVTALLSGRTQALQAMGIAANEQTVKEKALEMGLIKSGQALTTHIKALAILQIMYDSTVGETENLTKYTETLSGASQRAKASWSDFTLSLMEIITPQLVEILNGVSDWLINSLGNLDDNIGKWQLWSAGVLDSFQLVINGATEVNKALDVLFGNKDNQNKVGWVESIINAILAGLTTIATALAGMVAGLITFFLELPSKGVAQAARDAGDSMGQAYIVGFSSALALFFKGKDGKIASWIKNWWKDNMGIDLNALVAPLPNPPKPPTNPGEDTGDKNLTGEDSNLQEALDKFNEEILDAQLKLEQDMIDADIDLMRKLEDIDTEYLNKRSELWIDYQEKIGDINQDYNEKIKDIEEKENERKQKARNDALDKEKKFQNSMLELRENFLMSLEDALHARDARQILKLISQYNLDKLQAERKHALDVQSDKQDELLAQKKAKREIEQAKQDRLQKLREAKIDYEQKLAQLKRDEDAERKAARLADKRKREDLQRAMQDRLAQVAAGLVSEYNLTGKGLNALAKLYLKYYSNVAQIYAAMRRMLGGTGGSIGGGLTAAVGSSYATQSSHPGGGGAAEGGTMIANRPTTVTFAESGQLEMAQFTPLSRMGKDVSKVFSNVQGGGGGGMGGSVSIELLLSPDLEARVVENSLNKTAEIIMKVQRSK